MQNKTLTTISKWSNGNEKFTLITIKRASGNNWEPICTAKAVGPHVPFPCFEMTTTFNVVADWLFNAGYRMDPMVKRTQVSDTIDDVTGEVLSHWSTETKQPWKTKYTATAEKANEQKSIKELFDDGKPVTAYKQYMKLVGCSLTEAKTAVNQIVNGEQENKSIPELLVEGKYVKAVKKYHDVMGCGLKEAKEVVDAMRDKLRGDNCF